VAQRKKRKESAEAQRKVESRRRHEVKVKRPVVPHCKPTLTEKNLLCKLIAGTNCCFKHEKSNGDGGYGAEGGEKRKSNDELLGQLTKRVQTFKAQATKAESTAEKVGVETTRANLLEEINSIWMFKMYSTPSDKQVVQIRICQRLGTNFVGIDTDAAMSISGYKNDFAWICHNTARCLSFEFQGISGDEGAMTPTGEGPVSNT
jgi:hypothetical protein